MKKWLLIGLLAIIFTFGCVQTTTQKLQDDIPSNMFQCQSGDFVSDLNLCPTEEIEPVEELNNQSMEEIEEQPEEPGPLEEAKFTVKFSRSGYGWEQIEQNGIKSNYRGDLTLRVEIANDSNEELIVNSDKLVCYNSNDVAVITDFGESFNNILLKDFYFNGNCKIISSGEKVCSCSSDKYQSTIKGVRKTACLSSTGSFVNCNISECESYQGVIHSISPSKTFPLAVGHLFFSNFEMTEPTTLRCSYTVETNLGKDTAEIKIYFPVTENLIYTGDTPEYFK